MKSAEELRAEARRLRQTARNTSDSARKKELAAQALYLAQRAEAIDRSQEDPDILRMNIERYRAMLAAGIDDEGRRKTVADMLQDAEYLLSRATVKSK